MHAEYAAAGPTEVGRSGTYDQLELQPAGPGYMVLKGFNEDTEEWALVAEWHYSTDKVSDHFVRQTNHSWSFSGEGGLPDGPYTHFNNVLSIFIVPD